MNALTRLALRRPGLVVAIWLVLAAVSVPLMLQLPGALKAGGFDNPRGESAAGQRILERAFAEVPEELQVVLHDASGDVTRVVDHAAALARPLPHVASVSDYRQEPRWLSADRHTTFLRLGFRADPTTVQNLIPDLRERMTAALRGHGVRVHVTGTQALDYDLSIQSEQDAATAEMIAFPLLVVVLLLVFRSVAAMLVPVVLAGLALVTAMAVGYLIAGVTDVSILFTNAVSIIGLAVAVDYSLFIIRRYREELAAGADHLTALETAMRTAGHAVLFSGLAVVAALMALFIPRLMVFTSIALAGITVTMVALAMTMTLLPAVLRLMGRRIDWLSIGRGGTPADRARGAGPLARLHRRPVPLLLALAVLFALLAWPMGWIRLQAPVASASILPSSADSRQGIERLQADLDPRDLFPLQVVLTAPVRNGPAPLLDGVRAVTEVTGSLRQAVSSAQAVTDLGLPREALGAAAAGDLAGLPDEARAAFAALWGESAGRYVTRVVTTAAEGPDSDRTHDLVRDLRDRLPSAVGPDVDVHVVGPTAHGVDFDDVLVRSMPAILGTAALITFVLLAGAFRSWRLPLLALILNAMVVAASLGLLTLISQTWLGQRIDSTTPALVFAVMFGLSMDYMVIMISRMRESYLAQGDHLNAVNEGMRRTAALVNSAALIMVAVFVSFLAAKISIVQQLGLGLAIAVVLDAVIVRLLIMPATLHLLGPRVWGGPPRVCPDIPAEEPRPAR
ncbi:MMPL family transporter [Microtetraspora fusca]|uniref:MMPL family transporter n=1 Tax=Microtetraspora fusca TaxID=1997 RepID=UPI0009FE3AAF|nr:MMPL family transporter [Microtetraspora fusca]